MQTEWTPEGFENRFLQSLFENPLCKLRVTVYGALYPNFANMARYDFPIQRQTDEIADNTINNLGKCDDKVNKA